MNQDDWTRVGDLFAAALERPPGERARFILEQCGDRTDWLEAVNRLLAAEADADSGFLSRLDPGLLAGVRSESSFPEQVGPWRLIRPIGVGGMGRVFRAERADRQFEQRVAVKLLKRGMDSDAVLARFLRERQILAGLNHPHIARLIDGGVAGDGTPYFVMELVENGQPITRHCDERGLTLTQRLALMDAVCLAVEYAHRNLVVHRDLKPSNILVTADGSPKLLDFGIAKLLSAGEGEASATTLTRSAGQLLTPEYAAPEQFRGEAVTTSTDGYSLGAILYELLTGQRPFAARAVEDHHRLEREPPLMSSRVTDPELRRRLAGDLDVIAARALHPAPERRYASVEGLREDLRRHREGLPVRARPDTLGYRASRFIRRHRTAVVSATAIALLILLFAGTATWQAIRIRLQSQELAAERDRARREAAAAEQVADFLVDVFEVSDPQIGGMGDALSARELLDRGAEQIDIRLAGQPELQARMLGVIGRAYNNLLHPERAEPLILRGVNLWRSADPPQTDGLIAALQQLADTRSDRGDFPGAEQALREALALRQPRNWRLYVDLASIFHTRGAADRAQSVADTALRLYRSDSGATRTRDDLARLGLLFTFTRQWDEMEAAYARLVELEARERGPRNGAVALLYNRWAGARKARGDYGAADSLYQRALVIHQTLAPRSTETARTLGMAANNALFLRNLARADTLERMALAIFLERFGEGHPAVTRARYGLAEVLRLRGLHAEAVVLLRQVVSADRVAPGGREALIPGAEWKLALALRDGGRVAESLGLFRNVLADFEREYGPDFLSTAFIRRDYAEALVGVGQAGEAERQLHRAIEVLAKRYGPTDYRVDGARVTLGRALAGLGRRTVADTLLQGVEARLLQSRGPTDSLTQRARAARQALGRTR